MSSLSNMAPSLMQMMCICVSLFLGPVFFVAVVVPAAVLMAGAFVSLWAFSLMLNVLLLAVVVSMRAGTLRMILAASHAHHAI